MAQNISFVIHAGAENQNVFHHRPCGQQQQQPQQQLQQTLLRSQRQLRQLQQPVQSRHRVQRSSSLRSSSCTGQRRARSGRVSALSDITNVGAENADQVQPPQSQLIEPSQAYFSETAAIAAPMAIPAVPAAICQQVVSSSPFLSSFALQGPEKVTEYAADIVNHLFDEEMHCTPRPNHMDEQVEVNGKMRAILIDWLVEVHMKYKLRPETLYLAVNIVDRFLSEAFVHRQELQLLGVVGMFIAAKFEEVDPPKIADYVYISDNTYSRDQIINMECHVLSVIGFQTVVPTVAHFLPLLLAANKCGKTHRELVRYLLELALVEYGMCKYPPSQLVAAALLLSNRLLRRSPSWPAAMVQQTRYSEYTLETCANKLFELFRTAQANKLQAVFKKYMLPQHVQVAAMQFGSTHYI
eukprot:TRINITY_DN6164_c3_g1_i1.p1 TRINITY_DN6164_c3_g1~~TRINITY_DN6164_c3_g1_i1.p1  ORF type:complete len:429 (+),score=80.94 TRINITY_DN6164_c3_g1_i1:56-1288(+)